MDMDPDMPRIIIRSKSVKMKSTILFFFVLFFTGCQSDVPSLPPLVHSSDIVDRGESGDFRKGSGSSGSGNGAAADSVNPPSEEPSDEEDCGKGLFSITDQISRYMQAGQYDKASAHSRKCLGQ